MTGRPTPTRVLLVDDRPTFRRAAAALINATPGLDLVGEAGSGEQAVDLADELRCDLIVMDVRLPGIDGTEACRRILRSQTQVRIVLVSTYERADRPGVDGCGAARFVRKQDFDVPALMA